MSQLVCDKVYKVFRTAPRPTRQMFGSAIKKRTTRVQFVLPLSLSIFLTLSLCPVAASSSLFT